jgi:uncharacterized membrane protein
LAIACLVLLWIAVNLLCRSIGAGVFDPPPFILLQGLLTLAALCVTVVILASQRYADQLAGYREQLTLELIIVAEQKISKLIELLEEQRRDNPQIRDRCDPEAVLDTIKRAHGGSET